MEEGLEKGTWPLLQPLSAAADRSIVSEEEEEWRINGNGGGGKEEKKIVRSVELVEEVKEQLRLAGPLVLSNLLQQCAHLSSVMFVGHLDVLSLSAASMATSFANVTGFSFLLGMASALDTLCGQAYGAKQYHMLGLHMQRAVIILSLVSIPLSILWSFTGEILLAVHQDPEISRAAGTYARWMIPELFVYSILQCQMRFLQTQSIVVPSMLISGISTLFHISLCWVLVFKSSLGFRGAAVVNFASCSFNVMLHALYIRFSVSCKKTWTGFSKHALRGFWDFLKLSTPSASMVCLEWWSFELLMFMAGLLPNPKVETSIFVILMNTSSLAFTIPYGLGGAISTRVSNELGAGKSHAAYLAVQVVLILAVTEGIIVAAIILLMRDTWGYFFSNEEDVVRYVSYMMPLLALSTFMDAIQCVLTGTARGCGFQKYGAFTNLGAYYIVGIPLAAVLAFIFHVGGKGLWIGIMVGIALQMLSLLYLSLRTNWEQEAQNAKEGAYISSLQINT